MNKISLANKYRPKDFSEVCEQDSIRVVLENQIRTNNLKHVYLFCGGAGTGKTTTARIIANMMNEGKGKPIEIDCASRNGVDDMKLVQDECQTRPLQGKYKTFILDECHMITTAGWNSMLKIFEEPPEFVIFLLCTTDPQKILPTIMSRVQRFNFSKISTVGIETRLLYIINNENKESIEQTGSQSIVFEKEAVSYIARLAKGGMRDAITTLEKCLDYDRNLTLENVLKVTSGGVTEQTMLDFMIDLINKDANKSLLKFEEVYASGIDINLFLKLYIEFTQNCVKYLITKNSSILTVSDVIINWLESNQQFFTQIREQLLTLTNLKSSYNSEDLKIILESWIIQICS